MKPLAPTVREHARNRGKLDGADAQALEHALKITEIERDTTHDQYVFMVKSAADKKLDDYHNLASRLAAAENERDEARRERDNARDDARRDVLDARRERDKAQVELYEARDEALRAVDEARRERDKSVDEALRETAEAISHSHAMQRERDAARAELGKMRDNGSHP